MIKLMIILSSDIKHTTWWQMVTKMKKAATNDYLVQSTLLSLETLRK